MCPELKGIMVSTDHKDFPFVHPVCVNWNYNFDFNQKTNHLIVDAAYNLIPKTEKKNCCDLCNKNQ